MVKIKLCGMMRPEDICEANILEPDYVGFVFAKKSKRYVTSEAARSLAEGLNNGIRKVGVFVNEDPDEVSRLLKEKIIDLAQLHGDEDYDYMENLRGKTGCELIKAIKIRSKEDLEKAYKSRGDHILLDAGAGDGRTFDWELLKDFDRPYFLAGGLDPSNVGEAVRLVNPFGVDVSSGIERNGVKDPELMKQFVEKVRKNYHK